MNPAIQTREAITVAVGGVCLRGTYHKPADDGRGTPEHQGEANDLGLLFLNHGFLPRSAPGDSAAKWGDSFAQNGYPSFRFDLPGLGDSDGDAPSQMLDVREQRRICPGSFGHRKRACGPIQAGGNCDCGTLRRLGNCVVHGSAHQGMQRFGPHRPLLLFAPRKNEDTSRAQPLVLVEQDGGAGKQPVLLCEAHAPAGRSKQASCERKFASAALLEPSVAVDSDSRSEGASVKSSRAQAENRRIRLPGLSVVHLEPRLPHSHSVHREHESLLRGQARESRGSAEY